MFSRIIHVGTGISTSSFYGWITFYCVDIDYILFICSLFYLLLDIWIATPLGLWWVILLWTFVFKFWCGRYVFISLGTYLGVELLDWEVRWVTFYTLWWLSLCESHLKLRAHHLVKSNLEESIVRCRPLWDPMICQCTENRGRWNEVGHLHTLQASA